MTDAALKKLVRSRTSSKAGIRIAMTKYQTMVEAPTLELCQKTLKSMLAKAEKQCDTQRNNYESILEVLKIDGDDLTSHQTTLYEEHTEVFQSAMDELETLTAGLSNLSMRTMAYAELDSIRTMASMIDVRVDSSSTRANQEIALQKQELKAALKEYAMVIRTDGHLKELVARIGALLNDLTSKVPDAAPPTAAHPSRRDRSEDRGDGRRHEARPTTRLPRIQIPTFKGDMMEWPHFWDVFERSVCNNDDLAEDEKVTYLQQSIQDPAHKNLIDATSAVPGRFATYVTQLKARYDRKRKRHAQFTTDFFKCQPCTAVTEVELHKLHSTLSNAVLNLRFTGQFTAGALATSFAERLLPPELLTEWYLKETSSQVVPDIDKLLTFIETHANLPRNNLPPVGRPKQDKGRQDRRPDRAIKQEEASSRRQVYNTSSGRSCVLCKEAPHPLFFCSEFKALTVEERTEFVKQKRLCFNCLSHGHNTRECVSVYKCKHCGKPHHTTLHRENRARAEEREVTQVAAAASVVQGKVRSPGVFIPTLLLTAHSPDQKEVQVRAMVDTGATISLIKASVARRLGLKAHKTSISIVGAKGTALGGTKGLVRFVLQSRQVPDVKLDMTAYVVDTVAADLPDKRTNHEWKFLERITLGDPGFNVPSGIDLILGNDILDDVMKTGTIRGEEEYPRATNTIFGWVVEGRTSERELPAEDGGNTPTAFCNTITRLSAAEEGLAAQQEANALLRTFWEVEEVPKVKPLWTLEETQAMTHFSDTHSITKDGRYQVTLPRKTNAQTLGSSRGRALKRFTTNETSLIRRGKWEQFQEVINEYLTLHHAEEVPASELQLPPQDSYYMPMHAVLKASSTTTKLRVVFDASAATTTGVAFNDTLLVGPTIQNTLTHILLRFRNHRIAVSADISKMYRAIELSPADRDFHRFLWRRKVTDPVTDHRMRRVTFGVAASPFVATRVLQEIAANAQGQVPDAADSILNCFYVDDYLTGADTHEEASKLCHQVMKLLDAHGLVLRKWRSSSPGFLGSIPPPLLETTEDPESYGPASYQKTLGIHWDACSDHFFVSTSQLNLPVTLTKRLLSSDIHRTFDVLGWLTPVTLRMKILLQELWEEKLDWDEVIPDKTQKEWADWRTDLPELAAIPIRRYYFRKDSSPCSVQLHGFADASIKAYAAVIYIRAEYAEQPPTVTLVTAKSRVAPLKPLTVPKLELCGAQLLAHLMKSVMDALKVELDKVTCWTDSTIVLNWLDGSARRYRTYVANRIVDTLEIMPAGNWKHVPTTSNPADCASRGIQPLELISHPLWWTGPDWLGKDPINIPPQPAKEVEVLERKIVTHTQAGKEQPPWLATRFSTFTRLRRVAGWILRFAHQSKPAANRRTTSSTLSVQELEEADMVLLKASQERSFGHGTGKGDELTDLKALHPFRDKNHLLRVGGRLANAELEYSQLHPVILHSKDPLAKLLIRQCHQETGHAGPSLVLTRLSRSYHLLRAMRQIKAVCSNCIKCKRLQAKSSEQLMGQLPAHRVNPGNAFEIVGVDYAGPLLIKYAHVRKPTIVKAYVCVFICMATRAIHLEAVTDLTTGAFLACLERFVSRRGRPSTMYSDNGSNFIGAARQLEEALIPTPAARNQVTNHCASRGITWKFSPERAPHFGGMWEAGVKAMKHHLRRIMGDTKLTYEELATVLCRIEAMLNSRALARIHSHSEDGIDVLTPGHFLIGKPLEALPERAPQHTTSLTRRWNLCQELTKQFWKRWSTEYVTQLQKRTKWTQVKRNFRVDDIVIMKDDGLFTQEWPLARVIKTFPGQDGLVRVVLLRARNSTFKRPVAKLTMILPNQEEDPPQETEKGTNPFLGGGMSEPQEQTQPLRGEGVEG